MPNRKKHRVIVVDGKSFSFAPHLHAELEHLAKQAKLKPREYIRQALEIYEKLQAQEEE